jgi:hypothetical protein
MGFADGYGQWLDRNNVCYNDYSSLVIMVTDTCPCVYPDNYASNKRWCCGDMYHLDLSVWAYEKVSSRSNSKCHCIDIINVDSRCLFLSTVVPQIPRQHAAGRCKVRLQSDQH